MEFLIATIVAVILLVGVQSSCPHGCRCFDVPEKLGVGVAVSCNSRGLDSIPTGFPSDTYVLLLNNNSISKIEEKAFNNLPQLYGLHLGNNNISKIEENAFNNLPKIAALSLDNNHISKIEENAFNNLPTLTAISLMNNSISFVSGKAFVNLQQLKQLLFNMDCGDCENIPFWRWLRLDQRTGISITCNDFHGRQLSSLQQNDFTGCSGQSTTTTGQSTTTTPSVTGRQSTTTTGQSATTTPSVTGRQSTTTTGQSTTTTPSVTGTNGGNGSVWCSRQGDWKWLVYMFFMISLRYIMSNI